MNWDDDEQLFAVLSNFGAFTPAFTPPVRAVDVLRELRLLDGTIGLTAARALAYENEAA